MLSQDEQIEAILRGRTWELAQKYFAGEYGRFVEACTVTLEDLVAYVEKRGFPAGWVRTTPASYDGIYLVEQDGVWITYEQERGCRFPEKGLSFDTYEAALRCLLEQHYLPRKRP